MVFFDNLTVRVVSLFVTDLRRLSADEARAVLMPALKEMQWRLVWHRAKAGLPPFAILLYCVWRRLPSMLCFSLFLLYMVVMSIGGLYLGRREIERSVRKKLNARGQPVCVNCGYDLRGSRGRCPECGEEPEQEDERAASDSDSWDSQG